MSTSHSLLARFRDFWTHPTIAEMQAQMLREVWAEYRLRRCFPISYGDVRNVRPFLVGDKNRTYRLLDEPLDARSEMDRINNLWSPLTKRVIDEIRERGPFGYMQRAVKHLEREIML